MTTAPERLSAVIEFLLTSFTRGTRRVFILRAQFDSLGVELVFISGVMAAAVR